MNSINYCYGGKYKWRLEEDASYHVGIPGTVEHKFFSLKDGLLTAKKGYEWDGPSGPAIDTANFMRGSLFHDLLYQLMREGYIPRSFRKKADQVMRELCLADGMSKIRAWWVYTAVRVGAGNAAKRRKE